ncbi:MAG: 1-deoxy-D-xylulose-5-phosphate reductoisomerase [Bauldia sp.]
MSSAQPKVRAAAGEKRSVSVLGVTGSVGRSAVDLLLRHADHFSVEAVTSGRNVTELAATARRLNARVAVVADSGCYAALREALAGSGIEAAAGSDALVEAAGRRVDLVVAAIVGSVGLAPTLAAARAGSTVALANKEALVCAGDLFMKAVAAGSGLVLPVDSEHNAIFQALEARNRGSVERIVLTASGGPFHDWTKDAMAAATAAQAVAHPVWSMGAKISVDSATLMNKGLEVIEAFHLFGLGSDQIDVLVHRQSIVHGVVCYRDGSTLAQMSVPDMRVPLSHCLWWPQRADEPNARLDLAALGKLTFEVPDTERFPALRLARSALDSGGWATNILNAANEVAVAAFLSGAIGFLDIARVNEAVLDGAAAAGGPRVVGNLEDALVLDAEGRRLAQASVASIRG